MSQTKRKKNLTRGGNHFSGGEASRAKNRVCAARRARVVVRVAQATKAEKVPEGSYSAQRRRN